MDIPCVGGMLDGHTVSTATPEETIHQNGIKLLRFHEPYARKKGEKVTERLMTYTEAYALTVTPEGPVYRCTAPVGGVKIGDEDLEPSEGGAYDVWKWPDGKWHAKPVDAA